MSYKEQTLRMEWIKTIKALPKRNEQVNLVWTHPELGGTEVGQGCRMNNWFEVITTYGDNPEILKIPFELVDKWCILPKS
tara:strand:+ start:311 stop:550 length:240 start_codon:yes stop_codon:yes gene_type:complete